MNTVKLEKIGLYDIEKLILLADDILDQMMFRLEEYNDKGCAIISLCEEQYKGEEVFTQFLRRVNEQRKSNDSLGISMLVYSLVREDVDISIARYDSAEELIARIEPLKPRILGMFRHGVEQNGVSNETNYYLDEAVPDEYLLHLFAMRIRDRRIVFAAQRFERTYYLLIKGHPSCHDGDEWIGIFENYNLLRKAYEYQKSLLERQKEEDPYYKSIELQIYEFTEWSDEEKGECLYKRITPKEIWGE